MPFERAIVVIDPWSTGAKLAEEILENDVGVIAVFTSAEYPTGDLESLEGVKHTLLHDNDNDNLVRKLGELDIELIAVIPGAESGVLLADELAVAMNMRSNPPRLSHARRSKYHMGEAIREAGVRAVEQTIAMTWEDVEAFINSWNPEPFRVIVKPNQSAGSDDVFLCKSMEEVKTGFDKINGAINHLGIPNEGVLVQEFLDGAEYVVDTVSRDGEHKVCAIWEYDKREANNQFNVYFGMKPHIVPLDSENEIQHQLVEYIEKVLDALEIENGPGHAEIKMTKTGPCLVEIGSRCHGGNGFWQPLAQSCIGYDQISITAALYSDESTFDQIPRLPTQFLKYGMTVDLVSYEDGEIHDMPGHGIIKAMDSFVRAELEVEKGDRLSKTQDIFTSPGQIQLIHESREQILEDYEMIHSLLRKGEFFTTNNTVRKAGQFVQREEPQES
mmetsp:Transcript_18234/g.29668  ORF Transcript_18234/g.29668 Transcript_18234/m.29668 type:complete len:444 (-) Transcript_18234:697-2028(-)|eukprot:CAMPEP_0203745552 /NCGR_PEP_ID=MMETSP0098-20131031/1250_1 /ASSEMBLY_ACC=CAM_ASM_000208 /TAXON_ID=96639 /ORGANISM=" , Strain NY0313808BC1" /LENGTH=443 /DNA_ID=CAMNT_0050633359 /DNA_START=119 /DNA_END=1450 /DNA_ORIENTATION=-